MRKYVFASVLGLSFIAASLTAATPAAASTMWRNFGSTNSNPMFLQPTSSAQGAALVIHLSSGFTSQNWTATSAGSGFFRLAPGGQPFPGNMVAGASGGSVSDGTAIIMWPNLNHLDQNWLPVRASFMSDANGAACFAFKNRQDQSKVMGVSGNVIANNQPVIIWGFFDDSVNHADQFWCAYSSPTVPQNPPPFWLALSSDGHIDSYGVTVLGARAKDAEHIEYGFSISELLCAGRGWRKSTSMGVIAMFDATKYQAQYSTRQLEFLDIDLNKNHEIPLTGYAE